jgi:acetyl esterase
MRLYSQDLLDKITQRQEVKEINGIKVLVKNLPDREEPGAMDPRLYDSTMEQIRMMEMMPKSEPAKDFSQPSLEDLRKMFNGIKSVPVVETGVSIKNITITSDDGTAIPLRIYKPDDCGTDLPVLLFLHGGGFFGGSPDVIEQLVMLIVEKEKIPAVSVTYRLAPENPYPAGHNDCFSALKWLYANASTIGASKDKIVVSGDSAGGNLALYCTIKSKELGKKMVRAQMLLYPTVNMANIEDDLSKWSIDQYEIAKEYKALVEGTLNSFKDLSIMGSILGVSDVKTPYLTPYLADVSGMPPTLLTVGEHDYLKVECLAFAVKLNKAGVKTKTILYKGLGHAYGDNVGVFPQSEDCAIEMGKFIKENC